MDGVFTLQVDPQVAVDAAPVAITVSDGVFSTRVADLIRGTDANDLVATSTDQLIAFCFAGAVTLAGPTNGLLRFSGRP